jgi:hypothetical protein
VLVNHGALRRVPGAVSAVPIALAGQAVNELTKVPVQKLSSKGSAAADLVGAVTKERTFKPTTIEGAKAGSLTNCCPRARVRAVPLALIRTCIDRFSRVVTFAYRWRQSTRARQVAHAEAAPPCSRTQKNQ